MAHARPGQRAFAATGVAPCAGAFAGAFVGSLPSASASAFTGSLPSAFAGAFTGSPPSAFASAFTGALPGAAVELPPQPLITLPILAAGAFALVFACAKLASIARLHVATPDEVQSCLAVPGGDRGAAAAAARRVGGPVGELLAAGLDQLEAPAAPAAAQGVASRLAEQREWTLRRLRGIATRVAWTASAAPLLGLLGTSFVFARSIAFTVFDVGSPVELAAEGASAFVPLQYGVLAGLPAWLVHWRLAKRARRIAHALDAATTAVLDRVRAGS